MSIKFGANPQLSRSLHSLNKKTFPMSHCQFSCIMHTLPTETNNSNTISGQSCAFYMRTVVPIFDKVFLIRCTHLYA